MSTARVRAGQQTRPPKSARLLRAVVSQVSPLLVQIAGGASVPAIAIPGTTYTVGAAVLVSWQEPNVGPAHLVTQTPAPPLAPVDGTFGYSSSCTDWDGGDWRTALTRFGSIGSLTLAAKVTAAIGAGGLVGTLPSGFQSRRNFNAVASIYSPGWNGATAHLQFNAATSGGTVVVDWCSSGSVPSGALLTVAASYPLA